MLTEIIDKYYVDQQRDRDKTHFYISEAGKCPRQVYFSFKGLPKKDFAPSFLMLFDLGDNVHKMVAKAMLSSKEVEVLALEKDIPPEEIISGRFDQIIKVGNELFILDVKSINSRAYSYLKAPKEDNVLQINLYLHYFDIKKGVLLYVDKDTLKKKEWIIEYDKEVAEETINGLNLLRKQIDSNTLPNRLKEYPKIWKCRYCQYKKICDRN